MSRTLRIASIAAMLGSTACLEVTPGYGDPIDAGGGGTRGDATASGSATTSATSEARDTMDAGSGSAVTTADRQSTGSEPSTSDSGGASSSTGSPATTHTVFVSSTLVDGAMGGVAGGDAVCQQAADAAMLGGTWLAVLGDGQTGPAERITINGLVSTTNGLVVAQDAGEFWSGQLQTSVRYNEVGASYDDWVWTGSIASGETHTQHCDGWTVSAQGTQGRRGLTSQPTGAWIDEGWRPCDDVLPVYCISQ